jgi:hypothetical protein
MPRCPSCQSIATWKLLNNNEEFSCRRCSCLLARRKDAHVWSFVIGIGGGSIMGLGLYLGVEFEGRFVFSWSFLAGAVLGYLFIWSQMRLRRVTLPYRRAL